MARGWLEGGAELFPELFGELGKGVVHGGFVDQAPVTARMSRSKFSVAGWKKRLAGLAERPVGLTLTMTGAPDPLPQPGEPFEKYEWASISMVDEHGGTAGMLRLTIAAGTAASWGTDAGDRWMSFLAEVVGSVTVVYGEVAVNGNVHHTTAFDSAIGRNHLDSLAQSSEYIRGYSWITLCPAVLVERVGGVKGLRASGAFAEVRLLGSGDVLLLATSTPQEFDRAALRRVWVALAPVLPAGLPKLPIHEEHLEVVLEDAADVR
ncbi:hypothetical protein GCM10009554_30650 [Kribbella koreensis]|uniref:Suppressor of fused protein SUFU n=1 Tax=Kribbella koreensis TaxID=57909 RepID=A0ABN1QC69_9ACTN